MVVYLAEEIKDASKTLPRAMMTAFILDSILGFVLLVTIGFTLGDIDNVLASPTGYPFIQVFYNSTDNLSATNALTSILILTMTASTITDVAAASRQLWSFARDRALPFSDFFAYVSKLKTLLLHSR
jgi:amino acid transporter